MKTIHRIMLATGYLMAACTLQTACTVKQVPAPIVHAHRGGAAIYPENTITAMIHAVDIGVPVLEMDLHVTRDSQVVVSHDAYLNPVKALMPDGSEIPTDSPYIYIYTLDYDSLAKYDVGSRPNPAFPQRKNSPCQVPLIGELIDSVETYVTQKGLPAVTYNIEIKSSPEKDGKASPEYRIFADLCMRELLRHHLGDRLLVQCFDPRTLNYVHQQYPHVRLSYLVEDEKAGFDTLMAHLDFTPQVISPLHTLVDETFVTKARQLHMQIVPWTVDDKGETVRLTRLGVDAIITNQPDSVISWIGIDTNSVNASPVRH